MNLVAQSPVSAEGEEIGRLVGVYLNSATNQLVDLVVRGPAGRRPLLIIVPVLSVDDAADGEVRLSISAESCRGLTATAVGGGHAPASSAQATSRQVERWMLDFGVAVVCLDGPVGILRRILYDQYSYAVEALVIGTGEGLAHEVAVPMDWVREMHRERLVLSCTRQELAGMPPAPEDR